MHLDLELLSRQQWELHDLFSPRLTAQTVLPFPHPGLRCELHAEAGGSSQ